MKVTIFGATGGVGRRAVEQAIAAGHEVTVVARNPAGVRKDVRSVTADLASAPPAQIETALAGADAVLSAIGPRSKADSGIATRGTTLIVRAMKDVDTRRLIVVSASPVATVASPARPNPPKRDPGDGFFTANVLTPLVKAAFGANYADLAEMEDVVADSGLDWTVVRPPRLTNKALTGSYRTASDRNLPGGRAVSRADLAHFMLRAIERPDLIGKTVRIAA
jgi:putative NADH-flavin reductase